MMQLCLFVLVITCSVEAEDLVRVHNVYPVGENFSAAPTSRLDTVVDAAPPYTKPTGSCTWDGHQVHDCHCPDDDQYPFVGLIDGKVGAGMCLPPCNGSSCPPFPGQSTKCISDWCFVNCYGPCTHGTFCFHGGPPYDYLCLYPITKSE